MKPEDLLKKDFDAKLKEWSNAKNSINRLKHLLNSGNGVVFLAEDLLKNSLPAKYRNALLQNNLVLLSPYYPESPFSVANAMARNKYIYTMSIASIVAHSNANGGTWSGANEVLKNKWVPLWVQESLDLKSPNRQLIKSGANILTSDLLNNNLNEPQFPKASNGNRTSLFDSIEKTDKQEIAPSKTSSTSELTNFNEQQTLYDFFIYKLKHIYDSESIFKPKEIEHLLELKPAQISEWLTKAEIDNIIIRLEGRVKKYMLRNITD